MALIAPAFVTISPSFIEPGLILPYAQASGAFDTISGGGPRIRLGEDDLLVYMKRVDLRTSMASGTAGANQLPGVSIAFSQVQTPTYLLRVSAQYDHHDTAAAGHWGVGLPEAYRLGMRQGHFQLARTALLYGINPQNGEGLIHASGATAVTLPPDSNGDTTVVTYDNGQMALYLLQQLGAIKTRTNQLGIGRKFTILGPQRVLEQFEYPGIVQLVQYQRPGAGTTTTAGVVKETLLMNGDEIIWAYDDTLIGQGAGSTDAVIITMPEVEKPVGGAINTNEFAKLEPGIDVCTTMYSDLAAPREIISPLARGATDVLSEWRITSGWAIRPEAVTIISMQYQ
jgi:hypothetical protein